MTREDVIAMAKQAGSMDFGSDSATHVLTVDVLQRICELVAAKEREACAQVAQWTPDLLGTSQKIAAAIRDRGEEGGTSAKENQIAAHIGLLCSRCKTGKYQVDGNAYHDFLRCDSCRYVPLWHADGKEVGAQDEPMERDLADEDASIAAGRLQAGIAGRVA